MLTLVALAATWLVYSGPRLAHQQRRDGVFERYWHNAGNSEYLGLAIFVAFVLVTIG